MTRTPDGRLWIDLTDHEILTAYKFHVPNFYLKTQHTLPARCADGSPSEWAVVAENWARGRDLDLYVRQAWRHRTRGGGPLLDPYSYSSSIDRAVKARREADRLPPLPDHLGTWNTPETMPPSACRSRLIVQKWRRCRIQSLSGNDIVDQGIWRGNVAAEPGQYKQGYRREAFAGETRASAVEAFRDDWDAKHGAGAWERDPEVLVFAFKIKSMFYTYMAGEAA